MAYSPEEVIEQSTPDTTTPEAMTNMNRTLQVVNLENIIDAEMLSSAKSIRKGEPVLVKLSDNISQEIRDILVKRYQSQGWIVTIIKARGGECMRFTPAQTVGQILEKTVSNVTNRAKQFLRRFNHEHDKTGEASK
jgi:hypothetical protein